MFNNEESFSITVAQVMEAKSKLENDFNTLVSEFTSTAKGGAFVKGFYFHRFDKEVILGLELDFPKEPPSNGYYSSLDVNFIISARRDTESMMVDKIYKFQKSTMVDVGGIELRTCPYPSFEVELRFPEANLSKKKLFGIF
jgi:hypothetical protein